MQTCCVTEYREIPVDRIAYVEQELQHEILAAIRDGHTQFISGFTEGVDLISASIVAEEKMLHPDLFLRAAISYSGRLKIKIISFTNCDGTAMTLR